MTGARTLRGAERLQKLRAMTAREILHRVRYAAVTAVERRQHAARRLAPPDRLRRALLDAERGWEERLLASRRTQRPRFFHSVAAREEMRRLFRTQYPGELAATLAEAERASRHEFEFFGQRFQYEQTIPWQWDPVSRRPWPAVYHADVPVHRGDVGCGDVKYVWELNRQQFVIDLGKAWFLSGDADHLRALERLVRSWIDGNPYATGVNWSCALEPAFRTFSWLWGYYLTADGLSARAHFEWLRAFYDHGRFLRRHLELYSSPYNHLIAEAAALYMLGVCFPEFREAADWRARGRSVLEGRLREQFYGDGGSVEQSAFYHHATLGAYLLATVLAETTGNAFSADVHSAIERALEFSMTLAQPDGTTPAIGGADDGKPLRMEHLPFWDFRPYLAIGAVLFRRSDFKAVAGRFHEDALWLLGPVGLSRFDRLPAHEPAARSTALESSGYYVLRSAWSARADYVCFDCGEQAAGLRTDGVPNSMHGHADALSVLAWLDGRRVLVDSGLYAYNCGGEWEAHFRETAAHNTATVDGRDQARHIGKMAWSHSYRCRREAWHAGAADSWAIGSHDGYARGAEGIVHRRAVWLRPDSCLIVYDEFVGTGRHEVAVNYQFAPGVLEAADTDGVQFDDGIDVVWAGSTQWRAQIRCGGPHPADGWIAPSLGVRRPAPRLTLTCTTDQPRTSLLTVLAARTAPDRRRRLALRAAADSGGTLVMVSGAACTDWVAAAGIAGTKPIDSDALVTVCRVRDDGGIEASRIGGSHLQVDARTLLAASLRLSEPLAVLR